MEFELDSACELELPAMAECYESVGYTGGVDVGDCVLVACASGLLIAAVRLRVEEGELILRGMYVDSARRRVGVGSALLAAASEQIRRRRCRCVPYAHLRSFHAVAGFAEVTEAAAPDFLVARAAAYREKGEDVVLALRPAAWSDS